MRTKFYEKGNDYIEKPSHIKACKYELDMEDGWVVEFCGEEYGFGFEIFDTKDKALSYYNEQPQQVVKQIVNDVAQETKYTVDYYEPQPCLWHYETREIADFEYKWEEQVYEIIHEDDWIVDYGDGELLTINQSTINNFYEPVVKMKEQID